MTDLKTTLLPLKRFPIPLNFRELKASKYGAKVLANAFPKAGTHLLLRVISLLPTMAPRWGYYIDQATETPLQLQKISKIRRGQYFYGHMYWSPELSHTLTNNNIRSLLIIRDLRDIAVSNAYYLVHKSPGHRLHPYFKALKSDDERLMAAIVGIDGRLLKDGIRSKSVGEHAMGYLPWLNDPTCLTVRFEDLIGSAGGGSNERQLKTVRAIVNHLDIDMSQEQISQIASKAFFKSSATFRKGQIGDWRNHFKDEHLKAFNEVAGDVLVKLGYGD